MFGSTVISSPRQAFFNRSLHSAYICRKPEYHNGEISMPVDWARLTMPTQRRRKNDGQMMDKNANELEKRLTSVG
jgi:hypothetical protein